MVGWLKMQVGSFRGGKKASRVRQRPKVAGGSIVVAGAGKGGRRVQSPKSPTSNSNGVGNAMVTDELMCLTKFFYLDPP